MRGVDSWLVPTGSERDELVLSLLDYVTPLLQQYAARYRRFVSFDDLYQDACVHILRLRDAGIPAHKLRYYFYNRVRSRIIDKLKYLRRYTHQSLGTSISGQDHRDDAISDDLLPSPYRAEPPAILLAQERIADLLSHITSVPHARVALAQEKGGNSPGFSSGRGYPNPRAASAGTPSNTRSQPEHRKGVAYVGKTFIHDIFERKVNT